jgi:uncharacterized protein YbjT (DUF2867 family)
MDQAAWNRPDRSHILGVSKPTTLEAAMKVLVLGATGGTGRAAIEELQSRGHEVTAFVRRPEALPPSSGRLRIFQGDAMNPDDVRRAVEGQEAVVVALGISENPALVRLRGAAATPINVRSAGTRNAVEAMRQSGVRKLVVQSTYGVGETKGRPSFKWRLLFSLLLSPQIADTEEQERVVRDSGLEWVLVQPVGLTDLDETEDVLTSTKGEAQSMSVSRKSVARVLATATESPVYVRKCVAVSAAAR